MLTILALSTSAFAAADLTTTITKPTTITVDTAATYTVAVKNIGNKTAQSSILSIQLPVTHTSPQVYVMGTLGTYSSSCVQSGTKLVCNLGSLTKNQTKTVTFSLAVPWNAVPLDLSASVTTTSIQNSTSNDSASTTITPSYVSIPLSGDYTGVWADHCTGTGLTAYFECRLFPSSISGFDMDFASDGTLTVPQAPSYYGYWGQTSNDSLWFEIYDSSNTQVADFNGNGTLTGCFEGMTTFPNSSSSYVSPYEVCL